ncbi:hypothetical protein JL722_11662 [Aureococcus anophagefferens]|nr:hypothetical protein JL722_11662 [Aureococcus anophagefferens]
MASLPPLALKTRDKPLHRQLSMAPSRMDIVPEKIVMFTDAGTDLDDEMAMIFARYLIEFNFIDLLGVVSVLHPSFKRAQLARGTMDMIGLHAVPVAFGTDGGDVAGRNEAPDAASFSYMPPDGSERSFSLETGRTLLYRILVAAEPKSVGVVVIASLKDAALFLRDNEALFAAKVKEVSIMGGVTAASVDRGGLLEPDTAHNNVFDATAAAFFYRRCQELGVRLVVVGRDAAYQVPITRRVYEGLAHTGSPIGWRLRNAQRTSIEALWRRAVCKSNLQPEFNATFCGGDGGVDDRGAGDPIWDLVKSFNMYDTLALIAAVPLLRDLLFDPVAVDVPATRGGGTGASHLLIGVSKENDGFASPEAKAECASLLRAAYATGLVLDHHAKSQIVVTMQVQPNKADEFMGLALLRALIELQAVDLLGIVLTSEERFGETDAADFASRSPELFREKTLGAVVMGGVVATGLGVEDDGVVPCAALVPDADASNNRADEVAATFFTARCQALGVPMTVISRHLALACRLPRSVYDALGERGGPVGADPGARDVTELRLFLCRLIFKGVLMSVPLPGRPAVVRDRRRGTVDLDDAVRTASTSTTSASSRSRRPSPDHLARILALKSPK